MTPVNPEYQPAVEALLKFAESVTFRLSVIEELVRTRLNITEDEWKDMMIRAGMVTPHAPPTSLHQTVEGVQAHLQSLREV